MLDSLDKPVPASYFKAQTPRKRGNYGKTFFHLVFVEYPVTWCGTMQLVLKSNKQNENAKLRISRPALNPYYYVPKMKTRGDRDHRKKRVPQQHWYEKMWVWFSARHRCSLTRPNKQDHSYGPHKEHSVSALVPQLWLPSQVQGNGNKKLKKKPKRRGWLESPLHGSSTMGCSQKILNIFIGTIHVLSMCTFLWK